MCGCQSSHITGSARHSSPEGTRHCLLGGAATAALPSLLPLWDHLGEGGVRVWASGDRGNKDAYFPVGNGASKPFQSRYRHPAKAFKSKNNIVKQIYSYQLDTAQPATSLSHLALCAHGLDKPWTLQHSGPSPLNKGRILPPSWQYRAYGA